MASNDEDRRKLLKPKLTPSQALSIFNDFYVTNSETAEVVSELDSYDDANFLVKIDGVKALLKIHNGVESEKYLRVHSGKRAKLEECSAEGGSIIDLHSAIFDHLAKPEYMVTTCTTLPVKNPSSDNEDEDRSVCIRELPVSESFFICFAAASDGPAI